ncbi:MAG: hypothetical protein COA97_08470 [Flavobacteriales bacterium]|nr:MAG: hypothetical protein COA97_08470 [Flavobacteriales bacterium]
MTNNIYFKLLVFSISFFLLHYFGTPLMGEFYELEGIHRIHLFLAISTFLFFVIMLKIKSSNPERFGFAYLASVFIKMIASVIFLAPLIFGEDGITFKYIAHFFVAFFIYLFVEVFLLVGSLKK